MTWSKRPVNCVDGSGGWLFRQRTNLGSAAKWSHRTGRSARKFGSASEEATVRTFPT